MSDQMNTNNGTCLNKGDETDIPDYWVTTKLSSLAKDITYGYTAKSTLKAIGPRLLRITDIQDQKVDWNGVPFCAIPADKKLQYLLKSGDLVFARTGATVGKSYLIREEVPESVFASYLIRVRSVFESGCEYLAHYFKSPFYWEQITEFSSGIGQPNVNGTKLKELDIPLPPLAEQKQIANILDERLAQVDTLKARLDAIPKILKRFRQSVLAAAVSGRLTEDWRDGREVREWQDKKISSVATFQNGYAFKSQCFAKEGNLQVVKLGNIRDGFIDLENAPAFVSEMVAQEFNRFIPMAGDSLLSMTGTRFKKDYGFAALVRDKDNILINQRVGRFIPNSRYILGVYLNLFLRSKVFRDQFFVGETGGVNQGNVGSKHILGCELKLPCIEEQTEIIRRVEQLFAYADQIEQRVKDAQSRVNKLTQSILAKAFRGELTAEWREQNPDLITGENSAKALLAKIKAERELASSGKKPQRASKGQGQVESDVNSNECLS